MVNRENYSAGSMMDADTSAFDPPPTGSIGYFQGQTGGARRFADRRHCRRIRLSVSILGVACLVAIGSAHGAPMRVHISAIIPAKDYGHCVSGPSNAVPQHTPGLDQPKSATRTVSTQPARDKTGTATEPASTHGHAVGKSASLTGSHPSAPTQTRSPRLLPPAARQDGPRYPVTEFKLRYEYPRKQLPALARLMQLPIVLGRARNGYVAAVVYRSGKLIPRKGYPVIHTTLAAFNAVDKKREVYLSAINSIGAQLYLYLDHAGFPDVLVARSSRQFRGQRDMRSAADTSIDLVIHDLIITQIRTVASGAYFSGRHPIDNRRNAFVIRHSPVQVGPNKPDTRDIFIRSQIDDYLLRLNQQPGRQVSVGLSAGDLPDSMILDYDVHEPKPWTAYAQISNTGTPQTNPWIEDFGFIDNQLTNHDDILSLNYATAGFSRMQSVQGSYEFPLLGLRRIRGRIFADYNQYNASNVGLGNLNFNGRAAGGGGELIFNLAQIHSLFVYGIVGLQYLHESVDNVSIQQSGSGDFLLPYVTLRLSSRSAVSNFGSDATILGQWTPTQESSLNTLGRLNTNQTWAIFQGDVHDSFYLEPLLNRSAYDAGQIIPANQIYMSVSGQEAFGQRLIPQEEEVLGGLYTVRGYPQSIVAGDNAVFGTLEYRIHLSHLLPITPHQKTRFFGHRFNYAPPNHFTTPDWDLMLFTFLDGGVVQDSQAQPYEGSATLLSTGVGARLTLYNNFEFLTDWGVALHSISPRATGQGGVSAGSSQFNFLFEVSY
ncbi:MAG: hypothetical protein ACP5O1_01945 [Phycisphaerae bacterium]